MGAPVTRRSSHPIVTPLRCARHSSVGDVGTVVGREFDGGRGCGGGTADGRVGAEASLGAQSAQVVGVLAFLPQYLTSATHGVKRRHRVHGHDSHDRRFVGITRHKAFSQSEDASR